MDINNKVDQDYFMVNDHSLNTTTEARGKRTLDFGSTFGRVQYSNSDGKLELFINNSENNYLGNDNGAIHIILIKKETGEIVDDVCFEYDNEQKTWTQKRVEMNPH